MKIWLLKRWGSELGYRSGADKGGINSTDTVKDNKEFGSYHRKI